MIIDLATVLLGDCIECMKELPDQSVQMCVTSPPYFGLRDYGVDGQIGLEQTPVDYIEKLTNVFGDVFRLLKDDGVLWVNLGDSYGKRKNLLGIPWRFALAMQDNGWILRQDIIWNKTNAMPESVKDRCVNSHEYIFLFSKQPKYFFNHEAIKEASIGKTKGAAASFKRVGSKRGNNGICPNSPIATHRESRPDVSYDGSTRNKRSVWNVATRPYKGAHFATFPPELIEPCILAGSRAGDVVLDPFSGSGTTGLVSISNGRKYIGIELNPEYKILSEKRMLSCMNELKNESQKLELI